MAAQNCCQKNTTVCSAPSSRASPTGETHERRAKRQRSDFFATLRCRLARRNCFAGAGGDRENECVTRGRGAPGGFRGDGVWDQHRIWKTCFGAHFGGASAATTSKSGALARLRRGRGAERSGDARDDAVARECDRERLERGAAAHRRDALPDAEQQSASGDSLARFGG